MNLHIPLPGPYIPRDPARTLARTTDPITSHEAAADAAPRRATIRAGVLEIIKDHGPITHDQIIERYSVRTIVRGWPQASPSGIRTRVSELEHDHEVEPVPEMFGRSSTGRRAHLWRAVAVQISETIDHG